MALWTPAEITVALWLDAADSDTITLDSGVVFQWHDKSGNDRHAAQSTPASRPTYGTNVLTFDGSDDFLTVPWSFNTPANRRVFIVGEITGGSGTRRCFIESYSSSATYAWSAYSVEVNASNFLGCFGRSSTTTYIITDSAVWASGKNLVAFSQSSPGALTLKKNATEVDTSASYTTLVGSMDGLRIGTFRDANGRFLHGKIYEIVLFDAAITDDQEDLVEGYLAWKWGIEANLPSGHLYENSAPITSSDALPSLDLGLSLDVGDIIGDSYASLSPFEIGLTLGGSPLITVALQPFELGITMDMDDVSSFETGSAIIRYFCLLTGAADGLADVTLPMASFQARRRSGDPTFLQVIIPTMDYADEIAARPNGALTIQQAYEQNGVIKQTETIMETTLDEVNTDEGGTNQSTTLTGYSTSTYSAKSITLSGVTYRATRAGKYHYRLARPYIFLNPGDTVTFSDDGVSFVIDTMTYFINPTTSTIELASI